MDEVLHILEKGIYSLKNDIIVAESLLKDAQERIEYHKKFISNCNKGIKRLEYYMELEEKTKY